MADKNKNNYLWIGIAVVAVIVLAVVFMNNSSKENTSEENALNQITLTQDNFVYVESSYLNGGGADQLFCEKRKTNTPCGINSGDYTPDMQCPETDIFELYIKPLNIDSSNQNNINCKIYDGSNIVKVKETDINGNVNYREVQYLGIPASTGIGHITLFLDYMQSHNLMACCIIDDTRIADTKMTGINSQTGKQRTVNAGETYGTLSNEVCLPKIQVNPVC